ncbi:MAG TPA: DUF2567 domain-containing protein [Mycobacterium sp.]|nr:DUF2567 domain-containing protein [Mycobacterium sp.]
MSELSAPHFSGAPRISRRRAIVAVVAGLLVTGVLIGGLWALIAPSIHGVVALNHEGERLHDYLGNEADHFFVAAFLMLGIVTVFAVVAAVLVWQWRAHRGPGMVAALSIGVIGAAAAAAGVAAALVHLRYGTVDITGAPVTVDKPVHYFTQAPPVFFGHAPLQVACTVLLPAAAAALVYALLVAAAGRDDLDAYPPVDSPQPPAAVAVSPGAAAS